MAILRRNLTITSGVDYESPALEIFNANGTPYNFSGKNVVALFNKTLNEVDVLADVVTYVYYEFDVELLNNKVVLKYNNDGDPWYLDEGKYRYIVSVVDNDEVKTPIIEGELLVLSNPQDVPVEDSSPPPFIRYEGTPSPNEPDFPTFGMIWKDTSSVEPILKIWDGTNWFTLGQPSTTSAYVHFQSTPSSNWTINHNLGFKPSVELYTTGGLEFDADIVHTSNNQVVVQLNTPIEGYARLI